ncbi:MAG: TAXI family TRAP transporter solute-binding subunit [Gammaproteobacteria bacterium]|nr:TAXI family TRAP transporter solute-binding subunit [Gammaproteobacteria bacterium]
MTTQIKKNVFTRLVGFSTTAALIALTLFLASCGKEQDKKFATIGTGGVTGVYYPAGGAISKMVNENPSYGVKLTVESTAGSVFNINALMKGEIDLGIAQSDRAYSAWNGLDEWENNKQTQLRSVFALHPEIVNLIVAVDENIKSCADLKGKVISVGSAGSGTEKNAEHALSTCGLVPSDIKKQHLKESESAQMLQDERIAGYFYTVGHPNGSIKEAYAGTRKVQFVPFVDGVDALLAKNPFYVKAVVPVSLYEANAASVPSFGVKAVVLTSADVPEDVVYAITKEVFTNIDKFKSQHPSFSELTPNNMLEGLTAPFHPGAVRYYKEAGLM